MRFYKRGSDNLLVFTSGQDLRDNMDSYRIQGSFFDLEIVYMLTMVKII